MSLNKLQEILGVKFNNILLLKEALTHPSYANENNCPHNQRLEYLGDAVIELAMSTYLYEKYRSFDEGDMTKRRGRILGTEAVDGKQIISAEAPLSEIMKYAIDLRSMTQGRGSYELEFVRYEEVPAMNIPKIVEDAKRWAENKD